MATLRFFLLQAVNFMRNFAKFFVKITACCCLALSLNGCEKSNEIQILAPAEKSETVLNRAFFGKSFILDPHQVSTFAESALARDLFVGLMAFDPQGNIVPAVARHSLTEDGKKWLFVLDENAAWSNGEPVTADDFVASWQRLFDRGNPSIWVNYLVEMKIENAELILNDRSVPLYELGVRAVSSNTLEIELEEPNFHLPTMLAHVALLPSYQGKKPESSNVISNGAYRLTDLDKQQATLQAESEVKQFQTVVYHLAAANHILQGFDLVENPQKDEQHFFRLPRLCTYFYEFNFNDPFVGQKAVRQAIRSMINVPELSHKLGIPLHSVLPQTMRQNQDHLPFRGNAESILTQMGVDYSNVLNFTLTLAKDEYQHFIANRFMRQLAQSDLFRIRLLEIEPSMLEKQRNQQNFQIMPRNFCASHNDPRLFLRMFHSQSLENKSGYGNEKVDRWLDELELGNLNNEQRNDRISKIVQQINDDVAVLPLFQYQRKIAVDLSLRGINHHNDSGIIYSKDLFREPNKDKQ